MRRLWPATNADAASTAAHTASDGSAPSASRTAADAAKQSPAPHGSPVTTGAGIATAGASPEISSAPRGPSVTAIATACQERLSSRAANSGSSWPAARRASSRFGVIRVAPGTGTAPRGCGSQTSGTRSCRSAARTVGAAATPWP